MKNFKFLKLISLTLILSYILGNLLNNLVDLTRLQNFKKNDTYLLNLTLLKKDTPEIDFVFRSIRFDRPYELDKYIDEYFYKLNFKLVKKCEISLNSDQNLPIQVSNEKKLNISEITIYHKNVNALKECENSIIQFLNEKEKMIKVSLIQALKYKQANDELVIYSELLKEDIDFEKINRKLLEVNQKAFLKKSKIINEIKFYDLINSLIVKKKAKEFNILSKVSYLVCFIFIFLLLSIIFYEKKEFISFISKIKKLFKSI
tara:strand:- start:3125 stop:3904 length:780 start_codon:yes stop_codon:yes gene_type:complete